MQAGHLLIASVLSASIFVADRVDDHRRIVRHQADEGIRDAIRPVATSTTLLSDDVAFPEIRPGTNDIPSDRVQDREGAGREVVRVRIEPDRG